MARDKGFAQRLDAWNRKMGEIACYLVLPILGLSALEATLRYVFNSPTIWIWDVNIQLQAALVALMGGYTVVSGKFPAVDIFIEKLSRPARKKVEVFSGFISLLGLGILVFYAATEAWNSFLEREKFTSPWGPPLYPLRAVVALGILLLFLQLAAKLIHALAALRTEEKAHE